MDYKIGEWVKITDNFVARYYGFEGIEGELYEITRVDSSDNSIRIKDSRANSHWIEHKHFDYLEKQEVSKAIYKKGDYIILEHPSRIYDEDEYSFNSDTPIKIRQIDSDGDIVLRDDNNETVYISPNKQKFIRHVTEEEMTDIRKREIEEMQKTDLKYSDINILIDFALDSKDEEWFNELIKRKKQLAS